MNQKNEHSREPEDADSALKDAPVPMRPREGTKPPKESTPQRAPRNPDNVKDGSAQDGSQPLAGA